MIRSILTIGLLSLAAASQSSAVTLTFNDRLTWTSQVTSLINFDSGTQAAGTATNFGLGGLYSTNLQIDGYDIDTTHPTNLTRVNAGAGQSYFNWGTGAIIRSDDKTATNAVFARITFASPVNAFGFNFGIGGCPVFFNGCLPGAAGSVTVSAAGLAPITVNTVAVPTLAFWGVISDSQTFSTADIYINDTNRYLVLDNIAQGAYSSAPPPTETAEPGTLIQLAMGGLLLAFARRRMGAAQEPAV